MRIIAGVLLALSIAACTPRKEPDQTIGPALSKMLYAGEVVYIQTCASCHAVDSLANKPVVTGDKNLLLAVHPFDSLKEEDLANVLTFIRNRFGNKEDIVTLEDVKNFRNPPAQNK